MSDIIDKSIVIAKIEAMINDVAKKDRTIKQEVIDMLLDARKDIKDYIPMVMNCIEKEGVKS